MSRNADASMQQLVVRGVKWKFVSQATTQICRLIVGLLLARLLAPREYGLAGMALVVSGFVLAFSDLALGAALIQRRRLTERDRSTVFWMGVGTGALLTGVGVALSGPIARFYGESEVRGLLAALSLSFIVSALGTTQKALLTREMDFRNLELRLIIATLVGGAVGVGAAVQGAGPWAIIAQQLTVAAVSTVALWVASPWRPSFVFSFASLRSLAGFSGNVLGTRLLYYLHENAGSLLIGRFLGASALGLFSVAYTIVLVPFSRIAIPIGDVLFPAFSRLQDDVGHLVTVWIRALRVLAAICVPASFGLIVVAPDFVTFVLGERWSEAAPVVQILAWVGLLQAMQSWNSAILLALNRSGTLFRYQLLFFASHLSAFVIGLKWGVVGVAVAYAVSTSILEPGLFVLTVRAARVRAMRVLGALSGIVQAGVAMAAIVVAVRLWLMHLGVDAGVRLAVVVPVGIAVFTAALAWRAPDVIGEVRNLRRRTARAGSVAVSGASGS